MRWESQVGVLVGDLQATLRVWDPRINLIPSRGVLKGCDNGDHFSLYQPLFLSFEFWLHQRENSY